MRRIPFLALFLATGLNAAGTTGEPGPRPVSTYSIVARDAATGDLGVAVQSHWFSVGSVVPWARSGVGAVATQSFVEVSYGPLGLERMASGEAADEALAALLVADEQRAVRQVAFVDAAGNVAVHTGEGCIPAAGHPRTSDSVPHSARRSAPLRAWITRISSWCSTTARSRKRLRSARVGG